MAAHTSRSTPASGVAKAHRGLAYLILALGVLQFFLAGLGAFGETSYDAHVTSGRITQILGLVLVVLAVVGRRVALPASGLLLLLLIVQGVLGAVGEDVGFLGALHPVNGLAVLGVAGIAAAGTPLAAGHGRRTPA